MQISTCTDFNIDNVSVVINPHTHNLVGIHVVLQRIWYPLSIHTYTRAHACTSYQWTWKRLPLMLRSVELNTFSMTNTPYRDLVRRANGGIYRLRGGDAVAI